MPEAGRRFSSRRTSVMSRELPGRSNLVDEIKARVNKAVNKCENEPNPIQMEGDAAKEIEERLFTIEDDMLRISIQEILKKYRRLQCYVKVFESRQAKDSRRGSLFDSLERWANEDPDDRFDESTFLMDSGKVSKKKHKEMMQSLKRIRTNMEKVASLEKTIKTLKLTGKDTSELEKEKNAINEKNQKLEAEHEKHYEQKVRTEGAIMPEAGRRFSSRRTSVMSRELPGRSNLVDEIKARVNKAVNKCENEPNPIQMEGDAAKEIEERLFTIEDDMLRISIQEILKKYRRLQCYVKVFESRQAKDSRRGSLFDSLERWANEDPDDRFDESTFLMDSGKVSKKKHKEMMQSLKRIRTNMEKVASLEKTIKTLKLTGKDTSELEKEKNAINEKNQKLEAEHEKHYEQKVRTEGDDAAGGKTDYKYLKHAAGEIYGLLQRGRLSGQDQLDTFGEELTHLLKLMEEKDNQIEIIEEEAQNEIDSYKSKIEEQIIQLDSELEKAIACKG
jgi:hypothetical protein